MAKIVMSTEQRKEEGARLKAYFRSAQLREPDLTQKSLAAGIGVTQGLVGQWMRGSTTIPDRRVLWLSKRLGFDPVKLRPSILQFSEGPRKAGNSRLSALIQQIPPDQADDIADAVAPILEALLKSRQ